MNTGLKPSRDLPLAQAVNQALGSLLSAWTEIGDHDVIVHVNGSPVAVLIPFQDYQALQDDDILNDIRDSREAEVVYQEWLEDPSIARPYTEFRTELVSEGLLDE